MLLSEDEGFKVNAASSEQVLANNKMYSDLFR